jgi:hypothetical protein
VPDNKCEAFELAMGEVIIIALRFLPLTKVTIMSLAISEILDHLHINDINEAFSTGSNRGSSPNAPIKDIISPVDGKKIAAVKFASADEYNKVVEQAAKAFKTWRALPAPKRGEIVRQNRCGLIKNNWAHWYLTKWVKACRRAMAKCRK